MIRRVVPDLGAKDQQDQSSSYSRILNLHNCVSLLSFLCLIFTMFSGNFALALTADEDVSTTVSVPFIEMTRIPDGLAQPDLTPMLKIYGDGTVLVHHPKYMKNAGQYTMRLKPSELKVLLKKISRLGLGDYEDKKIKHRRNLMRKQKFDRAKTTGVFPMEPSEDTTTLIKLNLEVLPADLRTTKTKRFEQRAFRYHGLQTDAKQYPQIRELLELADIESDLIGVCQHKALKKK